MEINKPERPWFLLGVLSSMCTGAVLPIFGIFFVKLIVLMSNYQTQTSYQSETRFYSLMFLMMAFIALLVNTLTKYTFSIVAFWLTSRIRDRVFKKIMHMPVSWFEN